MPAPTPLRCLKSGCDFVTPQCPTWDPMMELLRMHVNLEHPSETPPAPAAGAGASAKMEKIRRPTLEENISETDWNFFESKWTRYKRSAKLVGEDLVDQLWACMSEGLERQCHDHGASVDTTTEEQLLGLMKAMSIRGVNKLCNVVEFLNLKQNENETIQKFISRVRGQALTCDFKIKSKCSKVGCSQETENSYADKLSAFIIVRGLYDLDIQEDVLKLAATTEDELDLKKVTEVVLAQEMGSRSRRLLNDENMGLNKLSQYKKQNKNRQADARVLNERCAHCGEFGHGHSASAEVREALCPAFGKQCAKCKFNNHYTSLCKKQRGRKANALDLEDRSSKASSGSESENELGAFGFFNTLKTKGKASSSSPPSVESDHYDADSDRSSVSPNTERDEFGWFCMSMEPPSTKSYSKNKQKIGKFKYVKKYATSAPQHVLHQPSSQQMKGTPGTQWKEIDTVADTLKKLSLMNSIHQTQLHGGRVNRI